jgi:hypothetical protein
MGAGQGRMSDPRARQMAAEGIRQRRGALAQRGDAAQAAPQGSVPGLESEQVFNPSLGVPGGATPGDAFAQIMNSRRGMR